MKTVLVDQATSEVINVIAGSVAETAPTGYNYVVVSDDTVVGPGFYEVPGGWDDPANPAPTLAEAKEIAINRQAVYAWSLLGQSDWKVVLSYETSTPMDPAWSLYRSDVRTAVLNYETNVNACVSVEEVNALADPTYPTPPSNPYRIA